MRAKDKIDVRVTGVRAKRLLPGFHVWERRLSVRNELLGPRRDPSSRTHITVRLNGLDVTFVMCAIAGDGLRLGDGPIEWDYERKKMPPAHVMFTHLTGMHPYEVERYVACNHEEDPMTRAMGFCI